MNELMQQAQQALYRIAELERKVEMLERAIQRLPAQYVSSLSRMDALAKEEYYPFGQPINKEDEY